MSEQETLRAMAIDRLGGEPEGEQKDTNGIYLRVTLWRGDRVVSYSYNPPIVPLPEPQKHDPPATASVADVTASPQSTVHIAAPMLDYRGMPHSVRGACGHWVRYAIDLRNGNCVACDRDMNACEYCRRRRRMPGSDSCDSPNCYYRGIGAWR